jgi:ectoine hydroxylase-related dioxygenase (phytanoyl-CoA dioxygenase family)
LHQGNLAQESQGAEGIALRPRRRNRNYLRGQASDSEVIVASEPANVENGSTIFITVSRKNTEINILSPNHANNFPSAEENPESLGN